MCQSDGAPPPRNNHFGTSGQTIPLLANHFPLSVRGGLIYHYDVDIIPAVKNRSVNRQIVRWLEQKHADKLVGCKLAFDGKKNLYTVRPLPSVSLNLSFKGGLSFCCNLQGYRASHAPHDYASYL